MIKLVTPKKLFSKGVVGMNMRNVKFIAENNPRRLYPMVDDKLQTKLLAQEHDIAVPRLICVVKYQKHVSELLDFLKDEPNFVIKPAKGSGGKGILVISGRKDGGYVKPDGTVISAADIHRHTSNTLSGLFSLGGNPDFAMVEEMVQFSDVFDGFTYQGVPDLRIIVYKGYPLMAMARLSTAASDGKANLHQGAVGAGLDIKTGYAIKAVMNGKMIDSHPDTGQVLADLHVPDWQSFLVLAARCYEMTSLGYLGVDLVLDKNKGPQILELNARPGLAIQMTNGEGLMGRISTVDANLHITRTPEQRVEFSMRTFGR